MFETLEDKRKALSLIDGGQVLSDLLCCHDFCRAVKTEHIYGDFHLTKLIVFCFHKNQEKNGNYYHVDVYEKDTSSESYYHYCGYDDRYSSLSHDFSWYGLLSYYKSLNSGKVLFEEEDYTEDAEMIAAFGKL